ncbi:MAG: hypothetical protein PHP86_05900 [Nevskiales bacterium]|nr:hypothetical protein [Nevskiales bacterium]
MTPRILLAAPLAAAQILALVGCNASSDRDDSGINLRQPVGNVIANIPPQCFTRTQDTAKTGAENPCYVCHAGAPEPNYLSQPELQLSYAFPQVRGGNMTPNEWSNLFVDRGEQIAAIPDSDVLAYVRTDNYRGSGTQIELAQRLSAVPDAWDVNGNGQWDGYVPDAAFAFDALGYDHDPDGAPTGWRAFRYYPFPGAFMPTNGSFDDVLIRLPKPFRQDESGRDDAVVYGINLAIVESLIRRADVPIAPVDEATLNVDLDRDGELGTARRVRFDWAPLEQRDMSYVGLARLEQAAGRVHLAAGLFPVGTEFLHSVRYLDLVDGQVVAAPRMKELRYSRKQRWMSYSDLYQQALRDDKEADLDPDRPEQFLGNPESGLKSSLGWVYQGFIEDRNGRLRPQTREESQFCVGCHGGLSATDDGNFAFSRKLADDGDNSGWGYWSQRPFRALPDPLRSDGQPEYATYLKANHAGDEYRANGEVRDRYFDAANQPKADAFAALQNDLEPLMLPSAGRALALNKAYWLVVREQSFAKGRDAMLAPARNVLREVTADQSTGIETPLSAPRLTTGPVPQ